MTKASYKFELQKAEKRLCMLQYLIEHIQNGDPLLSEERMFLLDQLYVKLHRTQKSRDCLAKKLKGE